MFASVISAITERILGSSSEFRAPAAGGPKLRGFVDLREAHAGVLWRLPLPFRTRDIVAQRNMSPASGGILAALHASTLSWQSKKAFVSVITWMLSSAMPSQFFNPRYSMQQK